MTDAEIILEDKRERCPPVVGICDKTSMGTKQTNTDYRVFSA
jgi:hypothetical protein